MAIRPEFINLSLKPAESNSWACEVSNGIFVGDAMRYEVLADNGLTLLVKTPITGEETVFATGDKIYLSIPEDHLLVYRQPEEGLEKALSLE